MTAWCLLVSGAPRGGVPRGGVPRGAVRRGGVLRGACLAAVLGLAASAWPVLLGGGSGARLLWASRLSWDHSCQQPTCMLPLIDNWTCASREQVAIGDLQML